MQAKRKKLDADYLLMLRVRFEDGLQGCIAGSHRNNVATNLLTAYNTAYALHELQGYDHAEILSTAKTAIDTMLADAVNTRVYKLSDATAATDLVELAMALLENTSQGVMSDAIKIQNLGLKRQTSPYYKAPKFGTCN